LAVLFLATSSAPQRLQAIHDPLGLATCDALDPFGVAGDGGIRQVLDEGVRRRHLLSSGIASSSRRS
jgi:hypothetical protein